MHVASVIEDRLVEPALLRPAGVHRRCYPLRVTHRVEAAGVDRVPMLALDVHEPGTLDDPRLVLHGRSELHQHVNLPSAVTTTTSSGSRATTNRSPPRIVTT